MVAVNGPRPLSQLLLGVMLLSKNPNFGGPKVFRARRFVFFVVKGQFFNICQPIPYRVCVMNLNFFQKAQGVLWPKVYENLVKNAFFC